MTDAISQYQEILKTNPNVAEVHQMWEQWQPHLIWMDMRMPVMDGYQAIQRIKAQLTNQRTVIIAVTASAFAEERTLILSTGCDDFIRKPLQPAVIFEKLTHYLGVRFIYDDATQSTSPQETHLSEQEIITALTSLSTHWLANLHQAAAIAKLDPILRLIKQIPPQQTALAESLVALVDCFRFDIIQNCIRQTGKL
ncbi:MAG: response regulator [Cyanothece sp. SIO1E1]|nr:response regulator [Cyanothece sp. SIO1E1]